MTDASSGVHPAFMMGFHNAEVVEAFRLSQQAGSARSLRLARVGLRVRDIGASIEFYRSVLGCRTRPAPMPCSGRNVRLMLLREGAMPSGEIELIMGRPQGASLLLDHFSVEVSPSERVDEICDRAKAQHARVVSPQVVDGVRRCVVFDPDGHKVEIFAHEGVAKL